MKKEKNLFVNRYSCLIRRVTRGKEGQGEQRSKPRFRKVGEENVSIARSRYEDLVVLKKKGGDRRSLAAVTETCRDK